jgi:hypothetical protein
MAVEMLQVKGGKTGDGVHEEGCRVANLGMALRTVFWERAPAPGGVVVEEDLNTGRIG